MASDCGEQKSIAESHSQVITHSELRMSHNSPHFFFCLDSLSPPFSITHIQFQCRIHETVHPE